MRGGGVWADTATGLQGIENWLNAHPALLSLMKNTGNLAAGATWLKNFTPAGIVIGLVTNYGYEQVLQLMEGRKDVAREALSSYFKAHDKDITQEQASYLANFSMEVLQAAGQVAVHQVAAKRFNAVKKGAGKAAKAAKVEGGVAKAKAIQLNNSQKKSIRNLEKQVAKHQQKLKEYITNPDKCDNRGFLKNKPAVERERLMQERVDSLQHQIKTFETQIKDLKTGRKSVLTKSNK